MTRMRATLAVAALFLIACVATLGASAGPKQEPVKLNVLFIGAHPDDEAFTIPASASGRRITGCKTGVVTITRGEGGGNAVGPEEGPALGLLREGEERRAVGKAGITDIFYLDTVDFYYTVSAPLTQEIWGDDSTLAKVVRIVRETRPDVIVTMDPAPSPGNHGNHQYAGRLAIEAFNAAADPTAFPEQLTPRATSRPWRRQAALPRRRSRSRRPARAARRRPPKADPTDDMFGVWMGAQSARTAA